jgi:hypothetical protein
MEDFLDRLLEDIKKLRERKGEEQSSGDTHVPQK